MSDTHYTYMEDPSGRRLQDLKVPDGDILIHAGDCTFRGKKKEWYSFLPWWSETGSRFAHRILMPGNHDYNFNFNELVREIDGVCFGMLPEVPNLPMWTFHATEEQIWKKLQRIGKVDVLITHGPPMSILDRSIWDDSHFGSTSLFDFVVGELRPKVHIFGHVHEGHGSRTFDGVEFYNVSICDRSYEMVNPVTVIEI
jgi:predicted phosphodiesterase